MAREKGLEPLAELILTQDKKCDPQVEGSKFINEEKGVKSADEALQGAMDIIAEDISDDADLRKYIRTLFSQIGVISAKASDENAESGTSYPCLLGGLRQRHRLYLLRPLPLLSLIHI